MAHEIRSNLCTNKELVHHLCVVARTETFGNGGISQGVRDGIFQTTSVMQDQCEFDSRSCDCVKLTSRFTKKTIRRDQPAEERQASVLPSATELP